MWPLRRKLRAQGLERANERELIALSREGSGAAVQEIMRRNNQRLFRTARGIIGSDWEAEEIVQDSTSVRSALSRDRLVWVVRSRGVHTGDGARRSATG